MTLEQVDRDYSQSGEQDAILSAIAGLPISRFLDIGAGDGETYSNTRALALRGWGGIVVEPAAWAFDKLLRLYEDNGRIDCVQAVVTTRVDGLVTFLYSRDDHLSTTLRSEAAKWPQVPFKRVLVGACSLGDLLMYLGDGVTVVSIDAEGLTGDLLEEYQCHHMWSSVRVICYEHCGVTLKDGWHLVASTPNNLIYARD
jgi:FkbM family methyltransferase